MQDANRDAGASYCVDCGYGAFCKPSPDVLYCYCKSALSGAYVELYNQCYTADYMTRRLNRSQL